jgi:hypothetical protein
MPSSFFFGKVGKKQENAFFVVQDQSHLVKIITPLKLSSICESLVILSYIARAAEFKKLLKNLIRNPRNG